MYEYVPVGEAVGVEGVRQQLPRSTHFIVLSNSTSSDTDYMYEYVPVGEAVGVEGVRQQLPRMRKKLMCH
ncbi:hypothetical protein J6590_103006 [Homalodisca vitripennis]|nr:hypothetical protein J6590_103006 [Homalodisca vitripennis]